MGKTFQIIALFLLVVAVPAISWYYLKTGLDYRLAKLGEMQDLGTVKTFSLESISGEAVTERTLEGNVVIAGFLSTDHPELRTIYGSRLSMLEDQFSDRVRVNLAIHDLDTAKDDKLKSFAKAYDLLDKPSVLLLEDAGKAARESFQIPLEEGASLSDNPYLVLIDTTLTIRNYYDVRADDQMKDLVEHMTLILPPMPKKDIYLRREKEK